jgi:WD40 repeat protein
MTRPILRPALLVAGLAIVLPLRGQDDPQPAERKKESPLPEGAKVRLGAGTPYRFMPSVALLPPDYKAMVVPDARGALHRLGTGAGAPDRPGIPGGGQLLISANGKRYINLRTGRLDIREVESGKSIAQVEPQPGYSTIFASNAAMVSLSADGTRVAQGVQATNSMGAVLVHDVDKNEIVFQAPTQYVGPPIPVLSNDGKLLATRRYQFLPRQDNKKEEPKEIGAVQVWDVEAGGELFRAYPSSQGTPASGMAFSSDGAMLAVSSGNGPVDVWDVPAKKHRFTVLGRTRQGARLAFSPDGKTLAAVALDGTIQRWNTADGKLLGTTEWPGTVPFQSPAGGLAFADNERVVAWGTVGQTPVAWEAPSGKLLSELPVHAGTIRSIAFAGDKEIVTAGTEGRIVRWDAATGRPKGEYVLKSTRGGFAYAVRNIAGLSPDGTKAMTSGTTAALYDLASGTEILAVPGGPNPAGGFAMLLPSPDLKTAFCLQNPVDRTKMGSCAVWDLEGQKKLGEVEIPPSSSGMSSAALSPSGERLVVAAYSFKDKNPAPKMVITGWDLKNGKKLGSVEDAKLTGQVQIATADETTAIVASSQGKARLINFESGKLGDEIESPQNAGYAPTPIVFSPDRKRFAMGVGLPAQQDFGVQIHEWPSAKLLHTFKGHAGMVSTLRFSPDSKLLASGSYDGTVLVWDMEAVKVVD